MGWRGCAALALALAPAAARAGAQQEEDPRDGGGEVVVTATPLFEPAEDALPWPARTASDEAIERAAALDLTDHLRRRAGGVFVNDVSGNPLQPDLGFRGFTASPTLGTPQGLGVFLDGVRVNQPFGDVVSWDLIPLSAIRSATLVPGSNPLFGRNALGGALSIRTKDGRSDPGARGEASAGSFGRTIARATVGGEAPAGLHWFASADGLRERGWRDRSPSRAGQAFAKLGWATGRGEAALSAIAAASELSGNGLQELRLLRRDRAGVYTYPDRTRNRALLVNLTARRNMGAGVSATAGAFWRRIATRTLNGDGNEEALGGLRDVDDVACRAGDEPDETCAGLLNRSNTRQREWGATAELTLDGPVPGHALTFGGAYADGRARFRQGAEYGLLGPDRGVTGAGAEDEEAEVALLGRTRTLSAYLLDQVAVTGRLRVDLSARFDRTSVRNRDLLVPDGPGSLTGDHRFQRLNPAASLRWTGPGGVTLDGAVAQTSRAPSAIELGCADPAFPCRLPNALAGDPPLDQVVARTVEGGVALARGRWRARAGAFRTAAVRDILFVASPQSGFGYFRNFGRTRRRGVDLDVEATLGAVELSAHYALVDATFRSGELVNGAANSGSDAPAPGFDGTIAIERGDRLPLVPRHLFKAEVAWTPVRMVTLLGDVLAASGAPARGNEDGGHRPDGRYFLGPGRSGGYLVLGAGAEWRAAAAATLFLRVDNLLDRGYATAAQLGATAFDGEGRFVQRPFAGPAVEGRTPRLNSTFLGPGAPRSIRLGVRGRF